MSQLHSPALNTAFKAARRAGDNTLRAANNLLEFKPDSKAFNDFAAEIRSHAAHTITEILREAYPDHRIISADNGGELTGKGHEWLIAPLEGESDYLHGSAHYAVAIALRHKGILQDALVFSPERNELYTASRGKGAWLNGRRLRVSARIEAANALVAAGFDRENDSLLNRLLTRTAGVRCEGAAVLDFCAVAAGRRDGLVRFNLHPCQAAAGALLVQEAGGIVTDAEGNEHWLDKGEAFAANPKILAQLLHIAAQHA